MDWNKPLFIWIGIAVIVFGLGIVLFQVLSGAGSVTGTTVIQYDNTRGGDGESGIGSGSNSIYSYASNSSLLSGSGSGSSAGLGSGSPSGSGSGNSTSPSSNSTSGNGTVSSIVPSSGSGSGGSGSGGSGSGTGSASSFSIGSDLDCVWWQSPAPIDINPSQLYCTPLVGPNQTDKLRLSMLPIVPIPGDVIVQLEQNGVPLTGFGLYYSGVSWSLSTPAPGIAVTSDTSGNIEVTFDTSWPVTNVCLLNLMPLPLTIGTIQFITVVPNQAPVADADGPYSGSVGSLITFDGSASYDPDDSCGDQIISWDWEFTGDGKYDDASGEIVQWSWGSPYSGSIGLNVTDTQGAWDTDEAEVSVTLTLEDFGDAPDPTYPTLLASNGPRHQITQLFLGASVDNETDGQPDANATGDDINNDDEDGVTFTTLLIPGNTANVSVVVSTAGQLDAWVDFNGNGDWNDAGEQVSTNQTLAAGVNNLSFGVPAGAIPGSTFARFRLSSNGGLSFDGAAPDGEVEDYKILISQLANQPPVADADGPYSGSVGSLITFNGSASYDPDEIYGDQIVSWDWEFTGDGKYDDASGEIVQWSWGSPYSGSIGLNVTDTLGAWDTDEARVDVTLAPIPPPVEVGGEVYPVDRLAILVPGLTLAAILIVGAAVVMRRRRARY